MAEQRVLHVDDDPSVTRLVATLLGRAGIEVTSINDPTTAIDTIVRDNFRVVVLDMDMPEIDGLNLLQQVKKHDGGIQVIMLTGIVTTTVALESMRLGANDCLFKPLKESGELIEAIADAFDRIERWRHRLRYLAERRKAHREMTLAQ